MHISTEFVPRWKEVGTTRPANSGWERRLWHGVFGRVALEGSAR
jgi:hypothetical protein